ncbi:MAG: cation:proton antiporter [Gammaproteobacteria bacterium]|nr:cation:proton antiporter [Gammaproteobacteria bacterium]
MHLDPAMPYVVGVVLAILVIGLLLRAIRQPHVVAYLVAGLILGPHGLGIVQDQETISRLGAIGVVLLLFFVGMEVSPKRLVSNWKVALIGTLLQVLISIACVWLLGIWLGWPIQKTVLIGFVISLSSTAVVLKLLQDWRELETKAGQDVLGVLLVQDLAVVPMLIIVSLMGDTHWETGAIVLQVIGGVGILAFLAFLVIKDTVHLPLAGWLKNDHEMQIFAALAVCFGFASLTAFFELSTALGAFAAGMLIGVARETQWVHRTLESFRVVFIALFFVSIGMLVNLDFLRDQWIKVAILVFTVLLTNTFINATILRLLGDRWRQSLYAGALLSQIGEFSFILAAVGLQVKIIVDAGYQLAIAVISISLLLSPIWISIFKSVLHIERLEQHGA